MKVYSYSMSPTLFVLEDYYLAEKTFMSRNLVMCHHADCYDSVEKGLDGEYIPDLNAR